MLVFGTVMKSEKNWLLFFRSSVFASVMMIIPVIQEWLKTGTTRVSVTLGNPIYVAVYFMFNFFFVLILWYKDVILKSENTKKQLKSIFTHWLTYLYVTAAFICAFGIWRTSTRGVILGLLGGLIVASIIIAIFENKNKLIKKSAIGMLVALALLIGGFLTVKNTEFVQKNTTLRRLSEISWSNVSGQGQARQYVWPMAISGFLEKPILGWGQDGFNNVFNKYYDPRMYDQEQWFDRAHDTPLDVLVAGGALGLLAYLSIFVAALLVIFKKRNSIGITDAGLLVGLLAAYFAQNIFVFDNLISYMFFYAVLAYIYSTETRDEPESKAVVSNDVANYVVAPVLIIVLALTLWNCNIKPINANLNLIRAMQSFNQSPETSLNYFKEVFAAKTFGSPEAREQIVSMAPQIINAPTVSTKIKQEFTELAYAQMLEQLKQTPNDARYQFFTGIFLNNLNQYQIALPHLQKSVELSPKKMTMMFELAKCYSYLGQKDKALEVSKTAYELMPVYNDAKMSYAAALILNGKEVIAKQLIGTSTVTDNVLRAYLIRASELLQKGDKNSAISEINKAINLVPSFKTQGEGIIKSIQTGTIK
jgi:O-antigen ligase